MKRQWQVHRQVSPQPDGERRWDRAYQLLIQWGNQISHPTLQEQVTQEKSHEFTSRLVCPRIDTQSGAGTDD